jgi:hypothetical protein
MKKLYVHMVTAFLAIAPFAVVSAEFDGSSVFTCASIDVMECLPAQGCNEVRADAVDIPRFIRVDVKNKQLTTGTTDDPRKTAIERMEQVEGKLMLQGAEDGREGQRDGVAWSMAVSADKGDMVLTASGDGVAFVVFGACTSL